MSTLLSTAEVAAELGVSIRRVQQLIGAGILRTAPFAGRTLLVLADSLEAAHKRSRKPGWPAGKKRKKSDKSA